MSMNFLNQIVLHHNIQAMFKDTQDIKIVLTIFKVTVFDMISNATDKNT